jgi:hypothetical protein
MIVTPAAFEAIAPRGRPHLELGRKLDRLGETRGRIGFDLGKSLDHAAAAPLTFAANGAVPESGERIAVLAIHNISLSWRCHATDPEQARKGNATGPSRGRTARI